MSQSSVASFGSPETGYGTVGYRTYVLVSLLVVYTFNFIDRILIGVVAEPLIREFQLQDWQFGLLSGFGFALLYTVMGIPIARLAERRNRVAIISICVILWSLMTALCGFATSFVMLLIFRVGVGIGEAGCTPPANSLIADYYTPRKRATALGVYSMGVTLGGVLAAAFGGPITDLFSWQHAFIFLGVPGILVGIIFWLTIKEPPRGFTDLTGEAAKAERASFGEALKELASKTTYWWMTAGATLAAFIGYGVSNFLTAHTQRSFELSTGEAAWYFNVPVGLASAFGTVLLGWIVEQISPRHPNAICWLPALGLFVAVPFYVVGFNTDNMLLAAVCLSLAGLSKYGYLTAQYTIGQGVVGMRTRATSIAILLFIVNLIGYGLGPLFVGIVSDMSISWMIANAEDGADLTRQICKGDLSGLGTASAALCQEANAFGLRAAMTIVSLLYIAAAFTFWMAGKTLQRDLVAR